MNRRLSIERIVATLMVAGFSPSVSVVRAEGGDEARFLPTLEDIQLLAPGWFDEVRSQGISRGSTFMVFRGWRAVRGAPRGEKASVLLNITIRPRPDPPGPWGPDAWRGAFEQKRALLDLIPELQVREIGLGAFAYIVTRSGGNHAEVTFYAEDWKVTVHNGTEEARLSYPAEAQALRIARWMALRLSQVGSTR